MRIHVRLNSGAQETYDLDTVNELLERGALDGDELAWRPGLTTWVPLNQVEGVRNPVPPPLPSDESPSAVAAYSFPSEALRQPLPPPASRSVPPVVAPPSVAPVPHPSTDSTAATSGPRVVGGWLSFFCLSITVLGPLVAAGQLMKSWDELSPFFDRIPGLRDFMILDLVGTIAIAAISIAFGALLWNVPPNGRTLAYTYLAVRFGGFVVLVVFEAVSAQRLPSDLANVFSGALFGVFIREALFLLIWGLYFKRSRRVRATFPEPAPSS